ncbi:MAG TPA: helix-turn-helix transcriptional regulator [Candidatus Competibacteraceae bacterium]|nr:helix-turn-helix transcriptional regulator [Candidatus Competibacteraceae bacterium]
MGHPLYRFRIKHKLSQAQLAALVGVSQGYIAHIENGRRRPSPDVAKRLEAKASGEFTRDQLLYPEEHATPDRCI